MKEILDIKADTQFKDWVKEIKLRIRQSQIKAAVKVNSELIELYWFLGKGIAEKQKNKSYGSNFFENLSRELRSEFPDMEGLSSVNLRLMMRFYLFYSQPDKNLYQAGTEFDSQLGLIPWRHHVEIFRNSKSLEEASSYLHKTMENGWSRAVLMNFIEADLYHAQGKSVCNFSRLLPAPQSDLAKETLKDPYNFDFLTLRNGYVERELEDALTENITKFLIELGNGFAYVGRQVRLEVGGDEFFIDLLFVRFVYTKTISSLMGGYRAAPAA